MNPDQFRSIFETLDLDETVELGTSIRSAPRSGPTLAFPPLSALGAPGETSPQLELGDTIGEGGMGIVRSARQLALLRDVAAKTLRPDRQHDAAREALMHEALVTGTLEHPNVVPVYTLAETEGGAPILVMKRIEGVTWEDCIADPSNAPNFDARDPLGWHLDIFNQVCLAVAFAHSRGIVHRDIKPENVMVGGFGEVYLLDWGIAVTTDDARSSYLLHRDQVRGVSGTPHYMAPEMTVGDGSLLEPRTDVYLLGACLHHVLTGAPPHQGNSLFEVMYRAYESVAPEYGPSVPSELAEIARKAMARDVADRFASAEALRKAVQEFVRHRSSIVLSDEAVERLVELEEHVRGDEARHAEPTVRNLFGEARFGFRQALKVWPENEAAGSGLRRLNRVMAAFEIDLENVRAAAGLLDELDPPDEELVEKLHQLENAIALRRAEIEKLKKLEHESSLSAGARARMISAVLALVLWTAVPFASAFLVKSGYVAITPQLYLQHSTMIVSFMAIILFGYRREFFANKANQQIFRLILAFTFFVPVHRFIAVKGELSFPLAMTLETATYGLAFAAVALLSQQRAWFGAFIYFASALVGFYMPNWLLEITGVANFLALGFLAYVWQGQRELSQT